MIAKCIRFYRRLVIVSCILLAAGLSGIAAGAASAKTIKFADMSWDSVMVHNRIMGFIIENGMDYQAEYMPGASIPLVTGLSRGDIHIYMESWTENIQEVYDRFTRQGKIIDLGPNFGNSWQGWLVPTYVIKGDPERGIEPMAPDLKSVFDLPKYWKVFKDPEDPSKGRFYNGVAGWAVTEYNSERLEAYGLDKYYNDFIPGSDAALSGSMVAAYRKGKPWLGYYWAPTWVLGKYDMTALEEPPFDPKVWETTKACQLVQAQCNILIWSELREMAPDVVTILKKYNTTLELNNKILAHMQDTKGDAKDGALYFLRNYGDLWTKWVPTDVADKVQAALK